MSVDWCYGDNSQNKFVTAGEKEVKIYNLD